MREGELEEEERWDVAEKMEKVGHCFIQAISNQRPKMDGATVVQYHDT